MFERYTESARRIVYWARYSASQFGSHYIEVAHLLPGLLRENFPTVARVAALDRNALQQAIEACHRRKPACEPSRQRVLGYAAEKAQRLGHQHIGPEHMLLGVLRENSILAQFGIELEAARAVFGAPRNPAVRGKAARASSGSRVSTEGPFSYRFNNR